MSWPPTSRAAITAGLCAALGAACAEPVPLEPPPEVQGALSAIVVVTRGDDVERVSGYDPRPSLEQIFLAEGQAVHAFLYDRSLAELGLALPLTVVPAEDAEAVGLPPAAAELALQVDARARWTPLEARPRVLDSLRLRGVTVEACVRAGGCFPDANARVQLACDRACAARIDFTIRRPELPRLDFACRPGWTPEDEAWALDERLREVGPQVTVRRCRLPERVDCGASAVQSALASECAPFPACAPPAPPDAGPRAYVPERRPRDPEGPSFATLDAAVAEVEAGTAILLEAGTFPLTVDASRVSIRGRCPGETTVQLLADGAELSEVSMARVLLVPAAGARIERAQIEDSALQLPPEASLMLVDTTLERVRVLGDREGGSQLELAGQSRVAGAQLEAVSTLLGSGSSVVFEDVRARPPPGAAALEMVGDATMQDFALEGPEGEAPAGDLLVVAPGGELTAHGLDFQAGSGALRVTGQANLRHAALRGADLEVAGASARLDLLRSSLARSAGAASSLKASDGARLLLEQVVLERVAVVAEGGASATLRDVVSRGDEIIRPDPPMLPFMSPTQYVGFVVDGARLDADRLAVVDVPAAVAGRRAFEARLADVVVSRPECEPFSFGPGPARDGLDLQLRDERRCQRLLYPEAYDYPHPPEAYAEPFSVELDGVWVRSGGQPFHFRNELQVAGTGRFVARDVRFLRTTSRGLLVQGDIEVDVERMSFADPGQRGACFFPAVRLEPSPDFGAGARHPLGRLVSVRSVDMDVGFAQLVTPDFEPDVEIRDFTISGARQAIFRARASDRGFAVPLDLGEFLIRNVILDVDGDLQGATPNLSCD